MKCPKCGKELLIRDEKVSVSESGEAVFNQFAVCTDCKKKWNLDKQRAKAAEKAAAKKSPAKETAEKPATSIKEAAARKEAMAKREASARVDAPVKSESPVRHEPSARREAPAKKLSADTTVRAERPVSRNTQPKRPQARPTEDARQRHAAPKASHQTYSNIPPKDVRRKREEEMKKGYDDLLSIEDEKSGSKAPIIILVVLIMIALAASGTIFYCKLTDRPIPFISQAEPNHAVMTASIDEEEAAELPAELQDVEF